MKRLAFILIVAICSGCARTPAYKANPFGEFASFVTDLPEGRGFLHIYQDGEHCTGLSRSQQPRERIKISANEPFTFMISVASTKSIYSKYCQFDNITFLPLPGRDYVAKIQIGSDSCRVAVVTLFDGQVFPTKLLIREYQAPLLRSGTWCGKVMEQ
jgi:hypothetical protein